MTPPINRNAQYKQFWPILLIMLLFVSIALAAPLAHNASLTTTMTETSTTAILTVRGIDDGIPIIFTLTDENGQLYILPALKTTATTWKATFPISNAITISAQQGTTILASTTLGIALPEELPTIIDAQHLLNIINEKEQPLDVQVHITAKDTLEITTRNNPIKHIKFNKLDTNKVQNKHLRISEPELLTINVAGITKELIQTYAIDPEELNFTNATMTITAVGTELHKCAAWNFTTQTCEGTWETIRTDLIPGQEYTLLLTPKDPAFGESDSEGTPTSCIFSDDAGQGDGDINVNCLTEIITQNSGYTADMDDHENLGAIAIMDINFTNSILVDTINTVNVTFIYQRQTDPNVGATTATIQVFDSGAYVTACTDTVTIGSWETYTCDLSTWVTTETELNTMNIRLLIDTNKAGGPKESATTFIDQVYLSADYIERDIEAPQYSSIISSPTSPTTYATRTYWFNTTWTDNFAVDTVTLENNFTGTLQNITLNNVGSIYYYSTQLPAGSYSYKVYANDTSNNVNVTTTQTYVINKATPSLTLTLNGTSNDVIINNSGSLELVGSGGEGTLELLRETTIITSSSSPVSTIELFDTVGTHNITLRHNATENYTYNDVTYTVTVQDTIPPGTVTSLTNVSAGETWITWTWTNPLDTDFDHVEVWLNNTFITNTTLEIYNATALNAETLYELEVRSVDIHDVKSTYSNKTGKTKISTDTTPPVITGLTTTQITTTSANISWTTDELAGCLLKLGTSSGTYTENISCAENKLAQTIILTNLNPETDYYYRIIAIDTSSNNITSPERSFTTLKDVTAPQWSNAITQPVTPTTYDVIRTYWFNTTWTDDVNVQKVDIESNFTGTLQNVTMNNITSIYYYATTLNAGTYVWRTYATDSSNNVNKTTQYSYTINKATPTTELYLDMVAGNNSINEDSTATLNATITIPTTGYLYLYYDQTLVDQGNDYVEYTTTYDLPGIYNVTLTYAGNNNYEKQTTTYWLTVDDTTAPTVTLTSPSIGHNDSDGIVVFNYYVEDDGTVVNCSLLINGTIEQTNTTMSQGANSFTKEDFNDGLYNWNIECYDTATNRGTGITRNIIIDKQTITIHIPATTTSSWNDADAINIADINATEGITESRTIPKNTQRFITWTNYTTANIPLGATIISADFNAYHLGNTKTTFEGVEWYDGAIYAGTGCIPVLQTGVYRTDSCNLLNYIDTVAEANDISLRYRVSAANTGAGGSISIDELYMTIVYIKETTPPEFSNIYDVTLDLGESLSAQYNATDNYGIDSWAVNNSDFAISDGLLTNTTTLTEGTYKLLVTVYDSSNNSAEQNVTITVEDIVNVEIHLDTTALSPAIEIYNSTGSLISSATTSLTDSFSAGKLYDIVIKTTLTSGEQKATLYNVNITQDLNITTTATETYSGGLAEYITSISPIFAINDSNLVYTSAQLTLPKAGLDIEYISHCTAWNFVTETCTAWEVNETTNYDYAENATHFTINVTSFDAFGGGPGDTLANITDMKLYDVTGASDRRTEGTLVSNGLSANYNVRSNNEYRAEFTITNEGKKWIIAGADVATHIGLNNTWIVNTTNDLWYTIAGTNYTGGSFTSGTISWDLSQGGVLDQTETGTWYYIFNVTSSPAKDYPVTFTINDTNKNSGSTDTSSYDHIYVKELIVNESSLSISTTAPTEGEIVTLNMTIYNVGIENATNFTIELWDLTESNLLYTENITVAATSSTTTQYNWTASIGLHDIELRVDTTSIITEAFENNNNISEQINVKAWHTFYGSIFEQLVLGDNLHTFYAWPKTNATNAMIYAADADAIINWNNLQALTRDTNNNSATQDLGEADINLTMTGYQDSIVNKYGIDTSTPTDTTTYTIYGKTINNIPVIDSTTTNDFRTGILWDTTTDSNGEYDGTEPLIFVTQMNENKIGTYGTYDYELTIPSKLQTQLGSIEETYFYIELQ